MFTFLGFFSKGDETTEEWASKVVVECVIELSSIVAVVMLIANGGA